jgi:hypothetical protein
MLIRITLIVAIIAGLAAGALNFLQIKEKINTTITERNNFHTERDKEATDKRAAQKLAKDTQTTLDQTKTELASTKDELGKAQTEAADQSKKAAMLADTLKKAQTDRDNAQNQLAAWHALGIPLENIKATLASLKTVTDERDAMAEERKILMASNQKYKDKLDEILNPDHAPEMPGVKGKVLVADPKYDFVVLDVGQVQGAREAGQLLVHRDGKMIAKVKIKSIQQNRCIANVMPGWKLSDVMEGDQVLY